MDRLIRVGRVSKIDPVTRMVSVTYPDLDGAVSPYLSVLSHNDEYKALGIGDEVVTIHLPSGQSRGIVLGHYWNRDNQPRPNGSIYRKELGASAGEAYISYDGSDITFRSPKGQITLGQIIQLLSRVSTLEGYHING